LGLLIALAYQALIKLNANTKEQGHGKHWCRVLCKWGH
jgi:polyferredoxin